jgi:hypothetical protein
MPTRSSKEPTGEQIDSLIYHWAEQRKDANRGLGGPATSAVSLGQDIAVKSSYIIPSLKRLLNDKRIYLQYWDGSKFEPLPDTASDERFNDFRLLLEMPNEAK